MNTVAASERSRRALREPFVVAPPTGAHTRTRLHVTADQEALLAETGSFLGSLLRADVALLCRDPQASRAVRKKALTAVSSSRWAGAITGAAEKQVRLSRDALFAEQVVAAVSVDGVRCPSCRTGRSER